MSGACLFAQLARNSLIADGLPITDVADWAPVLPFGQFCQESWTHIDAAPLVWSWHLDEWSDALEDAARRRFRGEAVRLVLEGPPGSTKSRPVSIQWQPWVWSWWPQSEWITTSWDESLAFDLSGKARQLVLSAWYQQRWPQRLTKSSDGHWSNEFGGQRHAAGIGTRVTGDHGHFRLIDDPVKEQLTRIGTPYQIAQAVGTACHFFFGTMGTRAIDHIGCDVITQQRLHPDDPAGVGVREHDYTKISFPAHLDLATKDPRDRRTHQGELLSPRLSEEKCAAIVMDIGPTAARAQLEQDPQAPGGQLLKAEYVERRWTSLPAELLHDIASRRQGPDRIWIIGGDLSTKAKRQARGRRTPDYVVYELWCAFEGRRYLCDEARGIWGFREAKAQLAAFALRHPQASRIILEDAANAAAVEDDLQDGDLLESRDLISALLAADDAKPGAAPVDWASCVTLEPMGGGCLARTQAVEGIWASGAVVLPADQPWVDGPGGFVEEHLRFTGDGTDTDDRVSVSSLVLLHLKARDGLPAWARAAQAVQARQQTRRR